MTKKHEADEAKEVKLQTTSEVGAPAPKKEPMKNLPTGHTYHDRLLAQAQAMGIETYDGQTDEMLIFRISMGGSV